MWSKFRFTSLPRPKLIMIMTSCQFWQTGVSLIILYKLILYYSYQYTLCVLIVVGFEMCPCFKDFCWRMFHPSKQNRYIFDSFSKMKNVRCFSINVFILIIQLHPCHVNLHTDTSGRKLFWDLLTFIFIIWLVSMNRGYM